MLPFKHLSKPNKEGVCVFGGGGGGIGEAFNQITTLSLEIFFFHGGMEINILIRNWK